MSSNLKTEDIAVDVALNSPPEYAMTPLPFGKIGSVATSIIFGGFVADKAYEVVSFAGAPTTIASGTLKLDLLKNGTTMLSTKATATAAGVTIAPVFSVTRIAVGDVIKYGTTSDSSTVTDVLGLLIIRPLLGHERRG